jgi:NAD(P)-dependent dehydrogenase (short-subunit alcohol dehydrogenase family)
MRLLILRANAHDDVVSISWSSPRMADSSGRLQDVVRLPSQASRRVVRHALITGAASGLGRALAVRLARDGWHVAVCDVDDAGGCETMSLVEQAGGTAQWERLDVTVPAEWAGLRDRLRQQWDRIDLVVNNAGVSGAGEVGRFSLDDWRWIVDVNLFGVLHGCHFFVDWLAENPHGAHIVNTASMAAVVSAPTMGGYSVSKAGVVALSETLYAELLHRGVGVTVLCPGFVPTNLLEAGRWQRPALKARAQGYFAEARITADDVAEATLRAIRRRQLYVVLPLRGRVFWRLKRLVPQWFMTRVAKIVGSPR